MNSQEISNGNASEGIDKEALQKLAKDISSMLSDDIEKLEKIKENLDGFDIASMGNSELEKVKEFIETMDKVETEMYRKLPEPFEDDAE